MSLTAKTRPTATISAVITRKDGTKEDLGVIATSEVSFLDRLKQTAKKVIKNG